MSTSRKPFARRLTAGLGIAAVAAATMLGGVLPAHADTTTPGPGNINPATPKSLTIHKYAQPDTLGTAPDGAPLPPSATSGLTPLAGVTFSVQRVTNIDLTTNAGWAATKNLTPDAVLPGNLAAAVTGVTAADGSLTFSNLAQAVYLVTETDPGANNIAFAAKPFLVTLPLPAKNGSTWIYDVHAYPKNALTTLTKSIDDSQAKGLGSDVTWTIDAKVPNASEGNTLQSFTVSDKLDSRLAFKSSTVTLVPATDTLVAGTDYTVDTTTTAGTVVVNFTQAGLLKLKPGATVRVGLTTTVASLGDGVIKNQAQSFVNDPNHSHPFTSNQVQTSWGDFMIQKRSAQDTAKTLQGAEFQVYASAADANAGTNPISVNGTSTFTTDASGIATVNGLRATSNGTATPITYWLVETQAPLGYDVAADVSPSNPKSFTVTVGKSATADINVDDPQTPPFTLPLTGGPGTVAFMIVGFGLLSIAVGFALYRRNAGKTVKA